MKKLLVVLLAATLSATMAVPSMAAKKSSDVVTHEELARMISNVLGLAKYLPPNPTPQDTFSALSVNGVSPDAGWQVGKNVTRADLARVIVQAIGDADKVRKPSDPNSWIEYLKSIGVAIDTVGRAVDNLKPSLNPVAINVEFRASTDPLDKPQETSGQRPDGATFGTDAVNPASFFVSTEDVSDVITEVSTTRPPSRPVTPN